eukprot:1158846-Pelagomonas_calceolata.AAC.2
MEMKLEEEMHTSWEDAPESAFFPSRSCRAPSPLSHAAPMHRLLRPPQAIPLPAHRAPASGPLGKRGSCVSKSLSCLGASHCPDTAAPAEYS